jgi:hypothetical protein
MRPTGLGHAAYKDVPDYSIFCGEWCIGRIYETAADPPICAGSRRCTHQEDEGCGSRRVPVRLCNGSLQSDPDAQIALDRRLRPIICQKADRLN